MIFYRISASHPYRHQLEISCTFTAENSREIIQIPFWRPGRYEPGNFPRNYIGFEAFANGDPLKCKKTTAHRWEVEAILGEQIELKYTCYASELTAGNTYFDHEVLLINPVNCLVYPVGFESEPSNIALHLPKGWTAATSFYEAPHNVDEEPKGSVHFQATDLQELLDTPILASADLHTMEYTVDEIKFLLHIHGERHLDEKKLLADFETFSRTQIAAFGSFPVNEYHFLMLFLPYKAYHGVEHEKSTVVILGPAADISTPGLYRDLLGVSSHELYHTWNVKHLRPADWAPYDYTRSGHSRLGYIAEGVTTYMGDWMLWQSTVFSDENFIQELTNHIQRHMDNEGRDNLSLADASVDTWTDGYSRSIPRRRVSIYVEGALLALVTDLWLLEASAGRSGLAQFMRTFYENYHGQEGFSETDWWDSLSKTANLPWDKLKDDVVDGRGELLNYVTDALQKVGLTIRKEASPLKWESDWGMKLELIANEWVVQNVMRDSPAERAGIWFGDKIHALNQLAPEVYLKSWNHHSEPETVSAEIQSGYAKRTVTISTNGRDWIFKYKIVKNDIQESKLYQAWKNSISEIMGKSEV